MKPSTFMIDMLESECSGLRLQHCTSRRYIQQNLEVVEIVLIAIKDTVLTEKFLFSMYSFFYFRFVKSMVALITVGQNTHMLLTYHMYNYVNSKRAIFYKISIFEFGF